MSAEETTGGDGQVTDSGSQPVEDLRQPVTDSQLPEDNSRPIEDRGQSPDDRRQPSDDRRQPPDDRKQPPDDRKQPPDDHGQPPDDRKQPPDDCKQPPDDRKQPPDEAETKTVKKRIVIVRKKPSLKRTAAEPEGSDPSPSIEGGPVVKRRKLSRPTNDVSARALEGLRSSQSQPTAADLVCMDRSQVEESSGKAPAADMTCIDKSQPMEESSEVERQSTSGELLASHNRRRDKHAVLPDDQRQDMLPDLVMEDGRDVGRRLDSISEGLLTPLEEERSLVAEMKAEM